MTRIHIPQFCSICGYHHEIEKPHLKPYDMFKHIATEMHVDRQEGAKRFEDGLKQRIAALEADKAALLAALKGLFATCCMVHSQWGENSNSREADEAIKAARCAITMAETR